MKKCNLTNCQITEEGRFSSNAFPLPSAPLNRLSLSQSLSNKQKCDLAEDTVFFSLSEIDVNVFRNIPTSSEGQGDCDSVFQNCIIEIKNLNESFRIGFSWFCSHILDRFLKIDSIEDYITQHCKVEPRRIVVVSKFNCLKKDEDIIDCYLKTFNIEVLQMDCQLLTKEDEAVWHGKILDSFD
jgi:hypothetical protein